MSLNDLQLYLYDRSGLPEERFQLIQHLFEEKQVKKGDYLVKENEVATRMIFLRSGYIRCFSNQQDKEITHWVFWKDKLVTDIPSFKGFGVSKWNYQAITDCEIVELNKNHYQQVRSILPEWDTYENQVLMLFFIALENRLSTFLSLNSKERYAILHEAHPEIFNQIPLIYLSSILGITPETISRIRRQAIS